MATRRPGSRASTRKKLAEYRAKRHFDRTAEPEGGAAEPPASGRLAFVIRKHAASHLHYDLRLEVGGVMRSWAVPKGPSSDPETKRLAMEVEDHPVEYNGFEGTIPEGEYGGGTVMLWDRGHYTADDVLPNEDESEFVAGQLEGGKLAFTFHGTRLKGSFALVRTRRGEGGAKPQWLLIKHRDRHRKDDADALVNKFTQSVTTGRTLEQIAAGRGGVRVWKSRARDGAERPAAPRITPTTFSPMLATTVREMPRGDGWVWEPKWDGMRAVVLATPDGAAVLSRNGNDKAAQFPEVARAAAALSARLGQPLVVDGEVVAVDAKGRPRRFGALQGRMHLSDAGEIARQARESPAALVAFDLLMEGGELLLALPWEQRRARLERVMEGESGTLRPGEVSADADEMMECAREGGWEGVMGKRAHSSYEAGRRSKSWLKLKLEHRQEFVVGGWTEPRGGREHLGALLLGYYDAEGRFVYAGHTGTGFTREGLADMHRRLRRLERKTSPFTQTPRTNEAAHWATPRVVVEVRFNEWTDDGKLRQPSFLGLRDDKDPKSVVREPESVQDTGRDPATLIRALEKEGGDGVVSLGGATALPLSNLGKLYFPRPRTTKGDLLAYYAAMAPYVLPAMKDRPLVLKRYPDGIDGKAFYQQSAPQAVPPGVRVETWTDEDGKTRDRLVGGDLATLLYTIQLGAISYDPWHTRITRPEEADYTILDLDPGPGASFRRVVRVAGWVKEEMDALGLHGVLKTSGSSGLHIYLPLAPGLPLDAATLLAQLVATAVARKHPEEATTRRMTRNRPAGTVYVDYLQNVRGKTVAGVYAVRARRGATVSTPLAWDELGSGLDMREFTLRSVPARVERLGDLWAAGMRRRNSLAAIRRAGRVTKEGGPS